MENDQMLKKIEWLDDERRKEKDLIAELENRLITVEADRVSMLKRLKDLEGETSRFSVMLSRFEQVDAEIAQVKVDFSRNLDGIEKLRSDKDRETEKVRRADYEELFRLISETKQGLDPIPELKKGLKARVDEEYRLARLIDEVEEKFEQYIRSEEDDKRSQKLLEENQRQDSKRIVDLQAEVAALRKRADEQRGKVDLVGDNLRKIDMRINELMVSEAERRQNQTAFIEKQNLLQVDRERMWKDWQARFSEITRQASELNTQLQALDSMNRTLKRSQAAFDEITQTFDRRVNEITELQRLVEERFRQEWVSFKADDQKRWTNYTLGQEEQQRELKRALDKQGERLVILEDMTQEVRDLSQQIVLDIRSRLQKLMKLSGELLEDYTQSFEGVS